MMEMKTVLFVCRDNAYQSQIAEAFARIHGDHHLQVYSAGQRPSGKVHPLAIQSMVDKGYDLKGHRSKPIAELPDLRFDYLISMGCGESCSQIQAQRREDWSLPQPNELPGDGFDRLRDEIERRVFGLLNRLIAPV
jgi:protein-tyrosine-phosphatase